MSAPRPHTWQSEIREAIFELRHPGEGNVALERMQSFGQVVITVVLVSTNLIGAAAVLGIAYFVVPLPAISHVGHVRLVNGLVAAGYIVGAILAGVALGTWGMRTLRHWLAEGRTAAAHEKRILLYAPLRLFLLQVGLWAAAAILFGVVNLSFSNSLAVRVAIIVLLTGLVTASCAYLLTERLLRPAAAVALADGIPTGLWVPGVATRALLAWLLGSGLPVLGVVAIGILALARDSSLTAHQDGGLGQLGVAMVVLGGVGISVGLLAVGLAARSTADPIDSVRRALSRVGDGDLDARVPVYDGTQIGQLQLGFNAMVAGLQERERIRKAFGTYVDPEIAAHILEEGTNLAGEELEVTAMFIDIRNFTGFAERTPADAVVGAINELFEQIVPVIHEHDGHVDKFVGDGLLAVFGAPRRQSNHADQALAAACEIARRVNSSDGLRIGVGLNSGTVVAGNVGGGGRFEFSVIGDPVNVAARVEAATRDTGDAILLTERTRELLSEDHPLLRERDDVALKGRQEKVRLYTPER